MRNLSHNVPLKNLADVRSGYSFRSRIEEDPEGDVLVFQIRGVVKGGNLGAEDAVAMYYPDVNPKLFLQRGDVLFVARGYHNTGAVVDFNPERAIASGQLLWMRPTSELIEPAYLAWYLNQRPAQQFLDTHKRGTRMPIITRKALIELPIALPSREVQLQFVELDRLQRREQALSNRLTEMRAKIFNEQVNQAIQVRL